MAANAKTLPYAQPGSAAENFGYTPQNIDSNLGKLFNEFKVKGVTSGGNKGIWAALEKFNTEQTSRGNASAKGFDQFLKTGKLPTDLDRNYAVSALDYGVREVSRQQQTKEPFLGGFLGPLITAGLGFIPGAGPFLAAASGAIQGGIHGGSPLDVILGGVTGYLGAKGTQSLLGKAQAFLGGGGDLVNAGALGLKGSDLALNLANVGSTVAKTTGSAALGASGSAALGLGSAASTLYSAASLAKGTVAPRFGTTEALTAFKTGADTATLARTLLGGVPAAGAAAGTVIGGSGGGSVSGPRAPGAPPIGEMGFGGEIRRGKNLTARDRTGANVLLGG